MSTPHSYQPGQSVRDLLYLFPHVEDKTMACIFNHSLPGGDLYKLDSRRILEAQWDLIDASLDDSASPQSLRSLPHAVDVYPTLDALLVPLNAYFSVLCLYGLARGEPTMLPYYFFRYSSHLVKIETQYEWPATLRYHLAFYARRCKEMRTGDYTGWGKVEVDLMEQILVPHKKNVKSRKAFGRSEKL